MGDLHFSSTSLLLHFDGVDGSVSLTDKSLTPLAVTVSGSAAISTAQSKFGGASFELSGGYATVARGPNLVLGSGDFTIEMWVRTSDASSKTLLEYGGAWNLTMYQGRLYWEDDGSGGGVTLSGVVSVNDGQWHHIAVTRESGIYRLFIDGAKDFEYTSNSGNYSGQHPLGIGASILYPNAPENFIGNIDDLRITKGVARYSDTFSVPTEAFPDEGLVSAVNAYCAAPSMLGDPAVFASPSVTPTAQRVQVWAEAPSPLAPPPATASVEYEPSSITTVRFGHASAALGMPPNKTSLQAKSLYAGVFGVASSSSALQAGPVASLSPAQISAVRMRVGLAASSMPSPVFGVVANHFRAQVESLATARFGGATTSHISFAESLMGARIGIPSLLLEGLSMGVSSLAPVQFGVLGAWGAALRPRPLHCIKFGQPRLQRGTTC